MKPNLARLKNAVNKFLDSKSLRGDAKLYSKKEWNDRGEPYGKEAKLTLVIDGSPMYSALNYGEDGFKIQDEFDKLVKSCGYWYEQGFAWSVHFYENGQ